MSDVKGLSESPAFRLGVLGAISAERFAEAVGPLGLKPKHVGLMLAVATGGASSQQGLAARMRVAPSLVVALVDHLVELGAVERVRDSGDRRRQVVSLTESGHDLLGRCAEAAASVDEELLAGLPPAQRTALASALEAMAVRYELPRVTPERPS